jgi:hypothetical protein
VLRKVTHFIIVAAMVPVFLILVGCGATNVERKTTGGIGLGALAGGLITGKPGGAIAGAAVGGLAGYAIGTDQDRHAEKMALEKERNEIAKARITNDPNTAYRPANRNDLVGTTWRVISIEGEQPFPDYHSLVTTFQTNSKITTLVIGKDGETQSVAETYQLVDDILVISGEEDGKKYVVDGKLSIENDTFVYVTPTYRVTGEKVN